MTVLTNLESLHIAMLPWEELKLSINFAWNALKLLQRVTLHVKFLSCDNSFAMLADLPCLVSVSLKGGKPIDEFAAKMCEAVLRKLHEHRPHVQCSPDWQRFRLL